MRQDQRDTFRKALASYNHLGAADVEIDDMIEDSQIVETAETVENFFDASGRKLDRKGQRPTVPYELNKTAFGDVYVWENQQRGGKGARRGTLYVMDLGDARACFFSGE